MTLKLLVLIGYLNAESVEYDDQEKAFIRNQLNITSDVSATNSTLTKKVETTKEEEEEEEKLFDEILSGYIDQVKQQFCITYTVLILSKCIMMKLWPFATTTRNEADYGLS